MNKILLLILTIVSYQLLAGEEEGTGESITNQTTINETVYQLVCTSELDSTQQNNSQYCVLVPIQQMINIPY